MPSNCLYRLRPESRNICTKAPAASVGRSGATMDQIAVAIWRRRRGRQTLVAPSLALGVAAIGTAMARGCHDDGRRWMVTDRTDTD